MVRHQAQSMPGHSRCCLHCSGLLGDGCQSQVESMKTSGKKVTRPELQIEVDTFLAEAKLKFEDLNRQDAFKRQLFEYALVVAEGGSVNPVGVAVSLFGILGIGAIADNRRKDGVINSLKQNA